VATEDRGFSYSEEKINNSNTTPIRVSYSLSNQRNVAKSGTDSFNPVNEPIDEKDFFKDVQPIKH